MKPNYFRLLVLTMFAIGCASGCVKAIAPDCFNNCDRVHASCITNADAKENDCLKSGTAKQQDCASHHTDDKFTCGTDKIGCQQKCKR